MIAISSHLISCGFNSFGSLAPHIGGKMGGISNVDGGTGAEGLEHAVPGARTPVSAGAEFWIKCAGIKDAWPLDQFHFISV